MSTALTYELTPGRLETLVFDVMTLESPDFGTVITQHPVEEGADITDHVRVLPITLSLDVTVTDYPLSSAGRGIQGDTHAMGSVGTTPFIGRAESILEVLQQILTQAAPCMVESGARVYQSLYLESIQAPRDKARMGALKIKVRLRQIFTASSEIVPLSKVSIDKARPKSETGHHEGLATDSHTASKSLLKQIVGVFR